MQPQEKQNSAPSRQPAMAGRSCSAETPNAATQQAIAELHAGEGQAFATAEAFLADLTADDEAH